MDITANIDGMEDTVMVECNADGNLIAAIPPTLNIGGADGEPFQRKRKIVVSNTEQTGGSSQKISKDKYGHSQGANTKPAQTTDSQDSAEALAPPADSGPKTRPSQIFLEDLVRSFADYSGADAGEYQSLSSVLKSTTFKVQEAVLEIYAKFGMLKNSGHSDSTGQDLTSPFDKMSSLLFNLKSLTFSAQLSSEFEITAEMRTQNSKISELISRENMEFLNFLSQKYPIVEVIYQMRAANALCSLSS